jgi:hypothetical protein
VVDPEIGVVEQRDRDTWLVRIGTVEVSVKGNELTPDARAAVVTLRTRLDEIMTEMVAADLVELESQAGRDTRREGIFEIYKLAGVTLEVAGGTVLLEVGFEPTWSQDHYVTVHVEDWQSAGTSIDS